MRNVNKVISETIPNINSRYALNIDEITQLLEASRNEAGELKPMDLLSKAFTFGYAMGCRATEKELNTQA